MLGREKALDLYKNTQEVERDGGMMVLVSPLTLLFLQSCSCTKDIRTSGTAHAENLQEKLNQVMCHQIAGNNKLSFHEKVTGKHYRMKKKV